MICELLRSGVFLLLSGMLKVLAVIIKIGLCRKLQWALDYIITERPYLIQVFHKTNHFLVECIDILLLDHEPQFDT